MSQQSLPTLLAEKLLQVSEIPKRIFREFLSPVWIQTFTLLAGISGSEKCLNFLNTEDTAMRERIRNILFEESYSRLGLYTARKLPVVFESSSSVLPFLTKQSDAIAKARPNLGVLNPTIANLT